MKKLLGSLRARMFRQPSGNASPRRKSCRLNLDMLEERLVPSTFTVTSLADTSTPGTLRTEIAAAGNGDKIVFASNLSGGTINLSQGVLSITNSITISDTTASPITINGEDSDSDFDIPSNNVTVGISGLNIVNGSTEGFGGGVASDGTGSTVTLTDCTIANCFTESSGAGVWASAGTQLTLTDCTLNGNQTLSSGGAVYATFLTMTNCTVEGNTADMFGGGDCLANGGRSTLINNTIADNTCLGESLRGPLNSTAKTKNTKVTNLPESETGGGGLFVAPTQTATLTNDIVANNTDNTNQGPDIDGKVNATFCLIRSTTGVMITGTNNIENKDPLLAPLGNYGSNLETMALMMGSPAIDSGTSVRAPTTDERGVSRPQGNGYDIGAFESQGFKLEIVSGNNQSAAANAAFAQSLVVEIVAVDSNVPVSQTSVTFTVNAHNGTSASILTTNPVTSDANSKASASIQANGVAGSFTIAVSALDVSNTVTFTESITGVITPFGRRRGP